MLNGLHMGMKVREASRRTVPMGYLNQDEKERAREASKGTVLVERNKSSSICSERQQGVTECSQRGTVTW